MIYSENKTICSVFYENIIDHGY